MQHEHHVTPIRGAPQPRRGTYIATQNDRQGGRNDRRPELVSKEALENLYRAERGTASDLTSVISTLHADARSCTAVYR